MIAPQYGYDYTGRPYYPPVNSLYQQPAPLSPEAQHAIQKAIHALGQE